MYRAGRAEVTVKLIDAAHVVVKCTLASADLSIIPEYEIVRGFDGSIIAREVVMKTFKISGVDVGEMEVVESPDGGCGDSKEVADCRVRLIRFLKGGSKDDS